MNAVRPDCGRVSPYVAVQPRGWAAFGRGAGERPEYDQRE